MTTLRTYIMRTNPPIHYGYNPFVVDLARKLGYGSNVVKAAETARSAVRVFREVFSEKEVRELESKLPVTLLAPHKDDQSPRTGKPLGTIERLDLTIAMNIVLNFYMSLAHGGDINSL